VLSTVRRGSTLVLLAFVLAPKAARAADVELATESPAPPSAPPRDERRDESQFIDVWGLDLAVYGQGFMRAPALALDGHERRQTNMPLDLLGVAVDFSTAKWSGDRWQLHVGILPTRFAWAVGSYPRLLMGDRGSLAELRFATTKRLELGFLSDLHLGVKVARLTAIDLGLYGAVTYTWADVANGRRDVADAWGVAVRGSVGVCRSLLPGVHAYADMQRRACAFVEPSVYDAGWLASGTAGLRFEL
jgi:hypothetical protein